MVTARVFTSIDIVPMFESYKLNTANMIDEGSLPIWEITSKLSI